MLFRGQKVSSFKHFRWISRKLQTNESQSFKLHLQPSSSGLNWFEFATRHACSRLIFDFRRFKRRKCFEIVFKGAQAMKSKDLNLKMKLLFLAAVAVLFSYGKVEGSSFALTNTKQFFNFEGFCRTLPTTKIWRPWQRAAEEPLKVYTDEEFNDPNFVCEDGFYFKIDCNYCTCSGVCTAMSCSGK